MAYGGLRGAVSFSLVEMLQPGVITPRQMFVTSTLVVILFTVFIQVSINSKMHSLHLTNQLPFYGRLFATFIWPSKNSCYDPFDLFNSFQGSTIKPLVGLLHIERDSKKKLYLMNEMNKTVMKSSCRETTSKSISLSF